MLFFKILEFFGIIILIIFGVFIVVSLGIAIYKSIVKQIRKRWLYGIYCYSNTYE